MGGTASEMSLSEEVGEGSDSEDSVYWDAGDGDDGTESSHYKVRDEADHTPELQLSNDQVVDMSQENIMDLKNESKPLTKTGPEPRETNLSSQATAAGDPALELHHGNEGPPQTLGFGVGIQSKITAESSNVVAPHIQSCTINQLTISTQNLAVQKPTESSAALLRRVREDIKSKLKKKFECIFEGIARQGKPTLFIDIYTELYIIEGGTGNINTEHEVRQIEIVSKKSDSQEIKITCIDIFKPFGRKKHPIRTVLTKGIAGIGKTVSIQKFILDWAEEKANPDIELIFSLPFRELNLLKEEEFSLLGLLQHYHPELKEVEDINLDCSNIVFILDGLDECQLPLAFEKNIVWFDITKPTTVDVLLTNLIKGNLLPSALLWVTTRPAAAKRIPAKSIHQVTEIRGFNDQQKEEYFQKRFNNPNLASRVIGHVKSSRSLYIMCHIPVFCWISATVLEHMLGEADCEEIPKTLTQMYTHFLLILININKQKYTETEETAVKTLTPSDKEIVLKLGELAFEGLEKGKLIFYGEDLRECDIDVSEASVYSGVFTEIFKEEYGLYQQKMFCFVHLSIQEYLAALFLFNKFTQREDPEEKETEEADRSLYFSEDGDSIDVLMLQHYKEFVDEALKSENGHLDLCLRFLFGLLLDTSQCLLQGFLTHTGSKFNIMVKMVKHIKRRIRKKLSAERSINLFHCLNELNDNSLTEEIQFSLLSGNLSAEKLAPDQCSALAYVVLMSEDVLEVFDLKKYKTNEEGYKRLLPIVKSCTRAILHNSNLTAKHCRTLVSALRMMNSHLRELDLSRNCLRDKGLLHLCVGLRSRCCRLQVLNLSDNGLKDSSVSDLCMMLRNPHSELRVLDLSNNDLGDDAIKPLSNILKSPYCKLQTLILGNNKLEDSAMKCLCIGLTSPDCKLEVLDLGRNKMGEEGLKMLCSGLSSRHCKLRTLDLSCNNLGDEGVKLLCAELMSPSCKLQRLGLRECSLTDLCCADLATVLRSHHSELRDLELRDNDLEDEGVRELSPGVQDPSCKLQRLGLSGCRVTESGCDSLSSALHSNPSHLNELDLSYNHPGDSGVRTLSALEEDPSCKLETLLVDHGGECRNKPRLWKYACQLTLDPNTAHKNLSLSEEDRKVTGAPEEQPYRNHPKRFKDITQVLCREGLSENRFYWEVEWSGVVGIGVAYGSIRRKGEKDAFLGANDKSWCLFCNAPEEFNEESEKESEEDNDSDSCSDLDSLSDSSHSLEDIEDFEDGDDDSEDASDGNSSKGDPSFLVMHRQKMTAVSTAGLACDRVGVYLDWSGGTLSFYSISTDKQTLLYTFHTTFTEPVYPGFCLLIDETMDEVSGFSKRQFKDWMLEAGLEDEFPGLEDPAQGPEDLVPPTFAVICQCK